MPKTEEEVLAKMSTVKHVERQDGHEHGIQVDFRDPIFAREVSRDGVFKTILEEQGLTVHSNSGAAAPEGSLIYEISGVPTNVDVKSSIQYVCEHLHEAATQARQQMDVAERAQAQQERLAQQGTQVYAAEPEGLIASASQSVSL